MKTILEHVEYARSKPHHIRKRIAFGIAGGMSALVALVWFVGNLSFGTFAIQGSTFADSTGGEPVITTDGTTKNSASGLAGAAAALPDEDVPAHIEIVDTTPKTPAKNTAEQTTIPF
ncbi:MAG: hypothetical protein Q8O94_04105 [bacterium]|nr:hypothetical protein [bacterium]